MTWDDLKKALNDTETLDAPIEVLVADSYVPVMLVMTVTGELYFIPTPEEGEDNGVG